MAEKKSREKTVKGGIGKREIASILAAASQISKQIKAVLNAYEPEMGKPRIVSRAKKPMERVVREMPAQPIEIPAVAGPKMIMVRAQDLGNVGLTPELVDAIRRDMAARGLRPQVERDVTAEQVERDLEQDKDSGGLLVGGCGCGGHVNITIARPEIRPLRDGSEELTAVAQLPIETIPELVQTLREMCQTRGVACP